MNRSYSKIRHIQESNLIIEQRIIMEQSDVWNSIKPIGNNPKGPKEFSTEFAASTKLTVDGKETMLIVDGTKYIPYVGARIQAQYNETITVATMSKMESVTALSSRFGCIVTVFVSTEKNAVMRAGGSGQAQHSNYVSLFDLQILQNRSGKFELRPLEQIGNNPSWMKPPSVFSVTNGGRYSAKLVSGQISYNLPACIGDLYTKINTELDRLGFPQIPEKVNITTAVTL
jgi:hypothetical protein